MSLELKLAFWGMSRLHPHCTKQATPITPHILLSIKVTLDLNKNKTEHIVYWSLFLLAFFTFTRKSNLVTDAANKTGHLLRKYIVAGTKDLLVTFNWTKTIQFGQRHLITPVVSAPQSELCPLTAYCNMITPVPVPGSTPVFVLPVGGKLLPVTYNNFQTFLKTSIQIIDLNPLGLNSHSFR